MSSQFYKFRRNFLKLEVEGSTGTTTSTSTGVVVVAVSSPQTGNIQELLLRSVPTTRISGTEGV